MMMRRELVEKNTMDYILLALMTFLLVEFVWLLLQLPARADAGISTESYVRQGEALARSGRPLASILYFDQALNIKPQSANVLVERGKGYDRLGKFQNAINDFDLAIYYSPLDFDAYCNRAHVWYEEKQYDLAISDYNKALQFCPASPHDLYVYLGMAYAAKGDYSQSIKEYSKAISTSPRDALSYVNRANVYFQLGDYGLAMKDLKTLIAVDPALADEPWAKDLVIASSAKN